MTDYDELSFLRKLAREQAEKIRAYQQFVHDMDTVGVMLIDAQQKRSAILDHYLKTKRVLNLNTIQKCTN